MKATKQTSAKYRRLSLIGCNWGEGLRSSTWTKLQAFHHSCHQTQSLEKFLHQEQKPEAIERMHLRGEWINLKNRESFPANAMSLCFKIEVDRNLQAGDQICIVCQGLWRGQIANLHKEGNFNFLAYKCLLLEITFKGSLLVEFFPKGRESP